MIATHKEKLISTWKHPLYWLKTKRYLRWAEKKIREEDKNFFLPRIKIKFLPENDKRDASIKEEPGKKFWTLKVRINQLREDIKRALIHESIHLWIGFDLKMCDADFHFPPFCDVPDFGSKCCFKCSANRSLRCKLGCLIYYLDKQNKLTKKTWIKGYEGNYYKNFEELLVYYSMMKILKEKNYKCINDLLASNNDDKKLIHAISNEIPHIRKAIIKLLEIGDQIL